VNKNTRSYTTSEVFRWDPRFSCGQDEIWDYIDYIQKYHYTCDCYL